MARGRLWKKLLAVLLVTLLLAALAEGKRRRRSRDDDDDDDDVDDDDDDDNEDDNFKGKGRKKKRSKGVMDLLSDADDDALLGLGAEDDPYKEMHHLHAQHVPLDEAARDAKTAELRAKRGNKPYSLEELKPVVLRAMEYVTDFSIQDKAFQDNTEEVTDAWLAMFYSNVTEVRNRVLQVMHIIVDEHGRTMLEDLQREFRDSRDAISDLSLMLYHFQKAHMYGLHFKRAPLDKWWTKALSKHMLSTDATAYNTSDILSAVLGWDPNDAAATPKWPDIEHALFTLYFVQRVNLTLPGAAFEDVLKFVTAKRPYLARSQVENASWAEYEHQVYVTVSLINTLSDYGMHFVDAATLFAEEQFLRTALPEVIFANNTELVADIVAALQMLRYDDTDPDVILGKTYLIETQATDGSWGVGSPRHPPIRVTSNAIAGLLPRTEGLWLTQFVHQTGAQGLVNDDTYHELFQEVGLGAHLPPPPQDVYVHDDAAPAHDEL